MRLLLTRPEYEAQDFKSALLRAGHDVLLSPVTRIEYLQNTIDLSGFDAVFITSANALHALNACNTFTPDILQKPIYVVGDRTAALAREIGFQVIIKGDGSVESLLNKIKEKGVASGERWIYPSGDIIRSDPEPYLNDLGVRIERRIVYQSPAIKTLEKGVIEAIQDKQLDGVLFFSPRAVDLLVENCRARKIDDGLFHLPAYCLSETIAGVAKTYGFQKTYVAQAANGPSMLQLVETNARG